MNKPKSQTIKALILGISFIVLFFAGMVGLAWFIASPERTADTNALIVEEPPIIYILDSDAVDIEQLSLTGLEIGVEKKLVFCVSSVYPVTDSATGRKNAFSLELAYTNNLGAVFDLYPAEITTEPGEDSMEYISQAGTTAYFNMNNTPLVSTDVTSMGNTLSYGDVYTDVQEKNQATYKKYTSGDVGNESLSFTADNGLTGMYNTLNCRFFVLDIKWPETSDISSVDARETDLVYIIARGGS